MITSVGNNTLQALTALNAFKGVNKSFNSNSQPAFELETSNGLQVNNRADILKGVDTSDIKDYATRVGENHLSDDDIRYGIIYGRSVIADYIA